MILRSLVSAGDQDDKRFASADEINAVAATMVDPHLRHATSDRLRVAGIADRKSTNSGVDAGPRSTIAQICQPAGEDLGLTNFDRGRRYPIGY